MWVGPQRSAYLGEVSTFGKCLLVEVRQLYGVVPALHLVNICFVMHMVVMIKALYFALEDLISFVHDS